MILLLYQNISEKQEKSKHDYTIGKMHLKYSKLNTILLC